MANETIELLKNYDPSKMAWPAMAQVKLDGVPARIIRTGAGAGDIKALTRQREIINSIPHILTLAGAMLPNIAGSYTGELYVEGMNFKDISGLQRNKRPVPGKTDKLILHVFDYDLDPNKPHSYQYRRGRFAEKLSDYLEASGKNTNDIPIRLVPGTVVYSAEEAEEVFRMIMQAKPNAEGMVLHSLQKSYNPAKRFWTTQRLKPQPTIDVFVVGFEEAVSKFGKPMGMVGRINVELTQLIDGKLVTGVTGVGPGALTHAERTALWNRYVADDRKFNRRLAEVKYMKDDSYDELRQPTFVRWRTDKEAADIYRG